MARLLKRKRKKLKPSLRKNKQRSKKEQEKVKKTTARKKKEVETVEKITKNTVVRQIGRTDFKEIERGLLGVLGVK